MKISLHIMSEQGLGFVALTKGKETCAAGINAFTSSLGAMNNQA